MRAAVVILFAALPAIGHDAQTCPWLNAATASGILGGAVNVTARPGACEFERQKSPAYTLRISVGSRLVDKCSLGGTAIKALGNEAVACSEQGKAGERIEWIIGRVRDQDFAIRLSTNDSSATTTSLREKARVAAEQVAGILF